MSPIISERANATINSQQVRVTAETTSFSPARCTIATSTRDGGLMNRGSPNMRAPASQATRNAATTSEARDGRMQQHICADPSSTFFSHGTRGSHAAFPPPARLGERNREIEQERDQQDKNDVGKHACRIHIFGEPGDLMAES